jgi:hypothetical protein
LDVEECEKLIARFRHFAVGESINIWWKNENINLFQPSRCFIDSDKIHVFILNNEFFWSVLPCGTCKNQRFGKIYHFRHQGEKNLHGSGNVAVTNNRDTLRVSVASYCLLSS